MGINDQEPQGTFIADDLSQTEAPGEQIPLAETSSVRDQIETLLSRPERTVRIIDYHPPVSDVRAEVVLGLSRTQKELPPKFFYDERGSQLFDQICALPEYYPTRTEIAILQKNAAEMAAVIGKKAIIIEYGSGSSTKVGILLDNMKPDHYLPIDISKEHLKHSVIRLGGEHPDLPITGICADYSKEVTLPEEFAHHPNKLLFFPGSSIGNFTPEEALAFLKRSHRLLNGQGGMLVGVDTKKDPDILNRAYNDTAGITAQFNLNILGHINRKLESNFDVTNFRHNAFYNEEKGRIEMHLESILDQNVTIGEEPFVFKEGETIHTENSYKYSPEEFSVLADKAGFESRKIWTDHPENPQFSVHYLTCRP